MSIFLYRLTGWSWLVMTARSSSVLGIWGGCCGDVRENGGAVAEPVVQHTREATLGGA